MNIDIVKAAGINYDKGLKRFMGDKELYELVLTSFLDEASLNMACRAYESCDYKALYECAHTIKGMSGNIEITELYETSSELSALLKYTNTPDAEILNSLFEAMCKAYKRAYDAIELAIGG